MNDDAQNALVRHVLHDIGYLSSFLHQHAGGRSGKPHVLTKLLKSGGHLSQRELQAQVPTSAATLSETLSKLEGCGLIERTQMESDRRQLDIRLTEAGRERAQAMEERKRAFEDVCLAVLGDEEQQTLTALLDRVVAHWQTLEDQDRAAAEQERAAAEQERSAAEQEKAAGQERAAEQDGVAADATDKEAAHE